MMGIVTENDVSEEERSFNCVTLDYTVVTKTIAQHLATALESFSYKRASF